MNNIKIIYPVTAQTIEQKLEWSEQELARLYIDREKSFYRLEQTKDYDDQVNEKNTAKSRVAEILHKIDAIKVKYLEESEDIDDENNHDLGPEDCLNYVHGFLYDLNQI